MRRERKEDWEKRKETRKVKESNTGKGKGRGIQNEIRI